MPAQRVRLIRFDAFELDTRTGELRKHGIRIRLPDQSVQILLMLLERPGEIVLREEIRLRLWPNNTIVEFDHSINAAIKRLRNALGESAEEQKHIETLAKRGYRFQGDVENGGTESAESPLPVQVEPDEQTGCELSGSTLSHYRILDKLGEGGMGVVYRAEDTSLGRQVAVKFLLTPANEIPSAVLRRFELEARAASALNHPNICTIYGFEDLGKPAIVMELVEGEPLSARLARGRLLFNDALRIGVQVAAAIAEAHRNGVVHRDIKPANIMLSKTGVKVLDFGLAKIERAAGFTAEPGENIPGVVLGTPYYMSPEQAEGKDGDWRSDIFSLGVILHEMIAGIRPFDGKSTATILAAILERDPPPLADVPHSAIERVVRRCIAKDPDQRWQSAKDLQSELEWIAATPQAETVRPQSPRKHKLVLWMAIAGGALVLAVLMPLFLRSPAQAPVIRFNVPVPEGEAFGGLPSLAVSPDGRQFIFVTVSKQGYQYWIRGLDSTTVTPVPAAHGGSLSFWSPDSRSIGFFRGESLNKVDLLTGGVQKLCAVAPGSAGATWSRDGVILFSANLGPIYRVPGTGGTPTPVTRLDDASQERDHLYPSFLPDQQHFLFDASTSLVFLNRMMLRVGSLNSLESKALMAVDSNVIFTGGYLFYVLDDTLVTQRFDPQRLQLAGDPVPIAQNVTVFNGMGQFSVSENGPLVFIAPAEVPDIELAWFDRAGRRLSTVGSIRAAGTAYNRPQLSPDGELLAVPVREERNTSIWLYNVALGSRTRFTFGPGADNSMVWSPDGRTIAFASSREGRFMIYRKAVDGSGAEELLYSGSDGNYPTGWSRDGHYLMFNHFDRKKPRISAWVLPLPVQPGSRPGPFRLTESSEGEFGGEFSPDGRWILYSSLESGRPQVYVVPFRDGRARPEEKRQVGSSSGWPARWRKDGKEIFFTAGRNLISVPVEAVHDELRFGSEHTLISGISILGYDVSSDGQRFLLKLRAPQAASQPLTVVQNWASLLKQ